MRGRRSIIIILLISASCLDPYLPPVTKERSAFLVVDGYIDMNGTARVRLSRSIPLSSLGHVPSEKNATVTIRSSSGETFTLVERDSATYMASNLPVAIDKKYTLYVRTANGSEYTSDEVTPYHTPPIDEVALSFPASRDYLEIRVSATDPDPNATGYYLWDVEETYKYHAPVFAGFKIPPNGGLPVEREPDELFYYCYKDVIKPSVMTTTKNLTENVVSRFSVALIEKGSEKLSIRYSILIKQRAISEKEYAFRTQLQKSSEQQGSLFAVIPGTVVGNVKSGSADEYVLGYFRAQHLVERREFIEFDDLPADFQILQTRPSECAPRVTCKTVPNVTNTTDCLPWESLGPEALITSSNTDGRGVVESYNYVITACGDCRYRGGKVTPPPFW